MNKKQYQQMKDRKMANGTWNESLLKGKEQSTNQSLKQKTIEKNSSEDLEGSTTFLDNEFERNFDSNLYEQALFSALSVSEKEQVLKSKKVANNSKDFQDAVNNPLQALGGGTNDLTYKGTSFFSRRNISWQIPI